MKKMTICVRLLALVLAVGLMLGCGVAAGAATGVLIRQNAPHQAPCPNCGAAIQWNGTPASVQCPNCHQTFTPTY